MSRTAFITLLCAFLVFALGAGVDLVNPSRATALGAPIAYDSTARDDVLPILPRVIVTARAPSAKDAAGPLTVSSVMFGEAVQRAGQTVAGSVGAGVRKVSLAIPYYAFGEIARRPTE
jgi:hypothetical protein